MPSVQYEMTDQGPQASFSYDYKALPLGHEVIAAQAAVHLGREGAEEQLSNQLAWLRQATSSMLGTDIGGRIDRRFYDEEVAAAPEDSFARQLGRSALCWISTASDKDLQSFCEWNVSRHQERDKALAGHADSINANTMASVELLIEAEMFPKHTLDIFKETTTNITLQPLDAFEAAGLGVNGYCTLGLLVALAANYAKPHSFEIPMRGMYDAGFHEALHASGVLIDGGFVLGVHQTSRSKPKGRIIEEVAAGHAEMVAAGKQQTIDSFEPDFRGTRGFYERRLLSILATHAIDRIEVDEVYDIFYSSRDSSELQRRGLEKRLDKNASYLMPSQNDGYDWQRLNQRYHAMKTGRARQQLVLGWLQQIYGMAA